MDSGVLRWVGGLLDVCQRRRIMMRLKQMVCEKDKEKERDEEQRADDRKQGW